MITDTSPQEALRNTYMAEVYQQHYMPVYTYILSRTRDPDLAEDFTQEVFIRMMKKDDFKKEKAISWLMQVATNIMIDHYRRKQVISFVQLTGTDEDGPLSISEIDIEADYLCQEALERLSLFPLKERRVIALYQRGYNSLEIAQILGFSPGAIKTCWYRIMCQLRAEASLAS